MSGERLTAEVLRQIPIFKGMNDTERRQLAEVAFVVQIHQGDLVLEQGKNSQKLWIVLEGECEVFKNADCEPGHGPGGRVRLALLAPYSNFGEMSFFHPAPHSANVRAVTAVKLLKIDRGDYLELVEEGASAAYKLACNAIDSLADRLRRMDEWVAELIRCSQAVDSAAQAGQPVAPIADWDRFRDKLFTGWNL